MMEQQRQTAADVSAYCPVQSNARKLIGASAGTFVKLRNDGTDKPNHPLMRCHSVRAPLVGGAAVEVVMSVYRSQKATVKQARPSATRFTRGCPTLKPDSTNKAKAKTRNTN